MDHVADFSVGDIVKVHSCQLESFREIAEKNEQKKRYRLCLHDTPDSCLQEMIICMVKGDYARPHKHHQMPESHMILRGRASIVLFSDEGDVTDAFVFDARDGILSYRINADIYHMTVLLSDTVVEYEVKPGPFDIENNIFPIWAPDGTDRKQTDRFLQAMKRELEGRYGIR